MEAGSVGKQALGSLPAALNEKLSQGLPMNFCCTPEKSLVLLLDTQIEPLCLCSSHGLIVHTMYVDVKASGDPDALFALA